MDLLHKATPPYTPKKGEQSMNSRQREHFKKVLGALKDELSQDIDRTVQTMQEEAPVFADPNDRASQESDIALELRNRDRERKLIKKIDETIARIDSGDYGYCDSCGVESFELPTSCSQSKRATGLRYTPRGRYSTLRRR